MIPIRIQRKRIKGWVMPEDTVYVGRPTIWGNPYREGVDGTIEECLIKYEQHLQGLLAHDARVRLKGKNLACFCSLDKPCHADILLKIANTVNHE